MNRRNALKAVPLAVTGATVLADADQAQATENDVSTPYAEIRQHNGAPTLFLKGQPMFFSALWVTTPTPEHWGSTKESYPWPLDGDFDNAQRTAAETNTHIYTFFTGEEWCGPGEGHSGHFDFSKVEASLGRILKTDPDALFHPRIQLEKQGDWWQKLYPEECEITSEGKQREQSYASEVWLKEGKEFLQAYIDHLARIGLVDRFIAYFICAGQSTEWTKWSSSGRLACGDYSEPMRQYFRSFLRKRYGDDISLLRKAWNHPEVSFITAEAPPRKSSFVPSSTTSAIQRVK